MTSFAFQCGQTPTTDSKIVTKILSKWRNFHFGVVIMSAAARGENVVRFGAIVHVRTLLPTVTSAHALVPKDPKYGRHDFLLLLKSWLLNYTDWIILQGIPEQLMWTQGWLLLIGFKVTMFWLLLLACTSCCFQRYTVWWYITLHHAEILTHWGMT